VKGFFARKPIASLLGDANKDGGMKKVLGPMNLTTLGIGAIIGAGIFVLTGQAAAQYAGPGIVFSFILSGVACAFAGLCYAEFASILPISGSAYTYAYATMGEGIGWFIGWNLVLEYLVSASTVSVGWSGYLVSFLKDVGVHLPAEYIAATGTKLIQHPMFGWVTQTPELLKRLAEQGIDPTTLAHSTAILNVPAMFIVAAVSTLLVIGIKESVNFNNAIVLVKLVVIVLFIACGAFFINRANLVPFVPENTGTFGEYGWSGILRGSGVIFFAYIGFDAVSTAAQEAKNPQRDMPIGILLSLGICTVLYILVSVVLTGMVNYKELHVADPIAVAVNAAGPSLFWLRPLIKTAALAGLTSVVLVLLMGQARIFFTMAKDGLIPGSFAKVHKKFQTPYFATIATGICSIIIAGTLPINILGELVSIGTLLAFAVVCIGVLVLRYKEPNMPRAFKTPFVPYVPILGAGFALMQMLGLPLDTWLRLIIWTIIGMAIYFFYGYKRSKLRNP